MSGETLLAEARGLLQAGAVVRLVFDANTPQQDFNRTLEISEKDVDEILPPDSLGLVTGLLRGRMAVQFKAESLISVSRIARS